MSVVILSLSCPESNWRDRPLALISDLILLSSLLPLWCTVQYTAPVHSNWLVDIMVTTEGFTVIFTLIVVMRSAHCTAHFTADLGSLSEERRADPPAETFCSLSTNQIRAWQPVTRQPTSTSSPQYISISISMALQYIPIISNLPVFCFLFSFNIEILGRIEKTHQQ